MYRWDFAPVLANADLLALGLLNTLRVTGTALVFGVMLGLGLALLRLSPRRLLSWPAGFVIEVFRTTPPLVQLFWFFFALPLLVGIAMTPFLAAALTFSIQSAAFFAEVFRAGIASIERGQWEAARAIGMRNRTAMRLVILPQALMKVIPPVCNQLIVLVKDTSLVSAIGVMEVTLSGKVIIERTGASYEVFVAVALFYLILTTALGAVLRVAETRFAARF